MSNIVRIKRRAAGGAAGAPSSLQNAELAFNEQDLTLYYGLGTGGAGGSATSVIPIAGTGAFVALTGNQSIDGIKTFLQTIQGDISGNSGTATKLQTARTINGVSFDGSGNITITANTTNALTAGAYLTGGTFNGSGAITFAVDATSANTASKVVARDASGNFSAGTITAALSGNASTASALQTARSITATGDASWTVSFDGSAAVSAALTLASVGTAGTYTKVTTDAKGRVTSGGTLLASDIPTLTASKISDFDTQVRTSGLDQMAAPTADVSFNSNKLTNLADPVNPQDAATKNYVDMTVQGLDPKASVKAATTANIASLSGTMTIDGVALVAGDRVLVKDQTTASQNGIYVVAAGAWARASDMNSWAELVSAYLFVEQGTVNAEMGFICTVDAGGTLGTTNVTFQQFNGAGQVTAGAGLTKTGNTIDIGTASSSRIVVNADSIDLATTGISAGTYKSVTVDTYGRVTAGTNPTTLAGYGITDAQPLDATLTALAGLTTAADQLFYSTGADAFAMTSLTSFGRSLIGGADAAAGRTTLGLGTIATQAASNVSITGGSITNLATFDGVTIDGGTF